MGTLYGNLGNLERAQDAFQQTLAIGRKLNDHQLACSALGNLGMIAKSQDQPDEAVDYFLQALEHAKTGLDSSVVRFTLNNIANTYMDAGRHEQAIAYYGRCLEANRETDNRRDDAVWTTSMGLAYVRSGQREQGRELYLQAEALFEKINSPEIRVVRELLEQLDD